ncbi:MAG: ParB N-terminal domain-containing protein [Pseudomonadota bacterium]
MDTYETDLSLEQIKEDLAVFQPRVGGELNEEHVENLARFAKKGRPLDPVWVWERSPGCFVLMQGHHRIEAYRRSGWTDPIPVMVHCCSEEEALCKALSGNIKDVQSLTRADKLNVAWRYTVHTSLKKKEVADEAGVCERTVGNMRQCRDSLLESGDFTRRTLPCEWGEARELWTERSPREGEHFEAVEYQVAELDREIGRPLSQAKKHKPEALMLLLKTKLGRGGIREFLDTCWDVVSPDYLRCLADEIEGLDFELDEIPL